MFPVEIVAHIEAMAVSMDTLYFQTAPTLPSPSAVLHADCHLAVGTEGELSSDHLEAIEMQAETQEVAATSIPDPLTLDGPEDRDIDLPQLLPCSAADNSGACRQNQPAVSRGLLAIFLPEIAMVPLVSKAPLEQKEQNSGFRAASDLKDLVQPVRM